jgi:putative ABC transport system substrate-binding protein
MGQLERRRFLAALGAVALASPLACLAQPTSKVPRIGWLKIQGPKHSPAQLKAFRAGMNAIGLLEGRDFVLEERYAGGKQARLPILAAELLSTGVSLIVATSQPSIVAAARVTKDVPVIGRINDDPVAGGLARSLGRPGGNVTGIYSLADEINPKRLSLLKEVAPSVHRVGVLLRSDWSNVEHDWQVAVTAARQLRLELVALNAHSADDLDAAFRNALDKGVSGMITFRNPTVVTYLRLIAERCLKNRLPAVFDAREYVDAGGLMSYGPNINAIYRQLATYANRLLHGIPPGEIPIEQPTLVELVINKRAADAMGIALPQSLLARADQVIE